MRMKSETKQWTEIDFTEKETKTQIRIERSGGLHILSDIVQNVKTDVRPQLAVVFGSDLDVDSDPPLNVIFHRRHHRIHDVDSDRNFAQRRLGIPAWRCGATGGVTGGAGIGVVGGTGTVDALARVFIDVIPSGALSFIPLRVTSGRPLRLRRLYIRCRRRRFFHLPLVEVIVELIRDAEVLQKRPKRFDDFVRQKAKAHLSHQQPQRVRCRRRKRRRRMGRGGGGGRSGGGGGPAPDEDEDGMKEEDEK